MEPKGSFQLKGKLFTLTVLQLFNHDLDCFEQELKQHVEMAPGFFNHTPIVIDLNAMEDLDSQFDFTRLKSIISSSSLIPVGVKGASKTLIKQIEKAGLAVLAESSANNTTSDKAKKPEENSLSTTEVSDIELSAHSQSEPGDTHNPSAAAKPLEQTSTTKVETTVETQATETQTRNTQTIEKQTIEVAQRSLMVKQNIRSGRQIYAPNGDLIIIGSVSAGAEVLADGNIHIYGTLRGRALAGIKGNTEAAVFCHKLQAELVSIAGIYKLSDDMPSEHIGQFSQVTLVEEKLQFHHLN